MLNKLSKITVVLSSIFLMSGVNAEDMRNLRDLDSASEGGMINMGGFEITPKLNYAMGRNDNVGLSNANQAKVSSTFVSLIPSVVANYPSHGNQYSAIYRGNYSNYFGSTQDNFDDHTFKTTANNIWSEKFKTDAGLTYFLGHDARNSLMFNNKELWHSTGVDGSAIYGRDGAIGQFKLAGGVKTKRYDTNLSGGTQTYNHDSTSLSGTFLYRIAPATQMIFEVGNTNFTYADVASKRFDSKEMRYLVGAKWEATAKTTGFLKVGRQNKTFDLGLMPSGNNTVWSTVVAWAPKEYSKVNFSLSQTSNEYGGVGSFIVSQDTGVNWTHNWTGMVTSVLSVVDGQDKFQNATRVDKRQSYGVNVSYPVLGWLRVGVGYQGMNRNSNVANASYKSSSLMFTLNSALATGGSVF